MARKLMKGSEAIGEAAIQAGCRVFLRVSHYPAERDPRIYEQASAAGRGLLFTGGKRGCRDQHGVRRGGCRRTGHDFFFQPGNQLKAGRDQLYRMRGASVRHRQYDARWAGARRHTARPGRLFPGDQGAAGTGITIWWCLPPLPCRKRPIWSWKVSKWPTRTGTPS